LLKTRSGFVQFALGLKNAAQVGMIRSLRRPDRDGVADHISRDLVAPALMFDHPEQMQAVGLLGVGRQDLQINPLGVIQPPSPVMIESILKQAQDAIPSCTSLRESRRGGLKQSASVRLQKQCLCTPESSCCCEIRGPR